MTEIIYTDSPITPSTYKVGDWFIISIGGSTLLALLTQASRSRINFIEVSENSSNRLFDEDELTQVKDINNIYEEEIHLLFKNSNLITSFKKVNVSITVEK